jgi:uncharacterized LabA/DUF88 family protein
MTENGSHLPLPARYAIMVDVGYIYASAGELLFGAASRREYRVDADKLIQALTRHADDQVRGELLRVYWYDAARDRVPTIDQRVIAQMPLVKLRLGNLNARGQQKGVDAQIRADMEALARHRAITDAVLVAGDEDMVPAVEAAQAFGVRVHLWGIEPPYGTNQAERLVWESDMVDVLDRSFIEPFFTRTLAPEPAAARGDQLAAGQAGLGAAVPGTGGLSQPVPGQAGSGQAGSGHDGDGSLSQGGPGPGGYGLGGPGQGAAGYSAPSPAQLFGDRHGPRLPLRPGQLAAPGPVTTGPQPAVRRGPEKERVEEAGEHVAQKWILTRGEDNIRDLLPGPILPPVIDKELLVEAEKELGQSLRAYQEAREWLRDAFWARVHRQFGIGVGKSRT